MKKVFTVSEVYDNINFLAEELKQGKIFVLPTGTIYGICGNALNEDTVKRIYDIKKRSSIKPLIVLVNNYDMLKKICYELNSIEDKIAKKIWPGPLTLVLKKKQIIPNVVTANRDTVGVRIDSSNLINSLIERANVPIVAPSANISGNLNVNGINSLENEVKEKVDYIVDDGILDNAIESTLVRVEKDNINVLREGKIPRKEILNLK